MKLRNRLHTTVWGVLFASLLALGGSPARLNSRQKAWGELVSGLQMTIHLNQAEVVQSKTTKFRVAWRNAGESDLVLNVGMMLANGQKQYLILPIPVGATFSIPVDLGKYWAAASKEFDYRLKPGSYSREGQFTGKGVSQQEANLDEKGIALMSYWMGTVTSNRLQFEVPSQ